MKKLRAFSFLIGNLEAYQIYYNTMIRKTVSNVQEALKGVNDGMTFMLGGFGLCGIPENAIAHLVTLGVKNITELRKYMMKFLY